MEIGAHAHQTPAVQQAMRAAQQIQVAQQDQAQNVTKAVNVSPEGQGNLASAVMAAQAIATPVGQVLRSDATAARTAELDSTKNVAGTGAAVASTADMASRAVVAPNPGQEPGTDTASRNPFPTEHVIELQRQRVQDGHSMQASRAIDRPASELYDNARQRAASFNEQNPVFVVTPPELPAVETEVRLFESLGDLPTRGPAAE